MVYMSLCRAVAMILNATTCGHQMQTASIASPHIEIFISLDMDMVKINSKNIKLLVFLFNFPSFASRLSTCCEGVYNGN